MLIEGFQLDQISLDVSEEAGILINEKKKY